MIPSLLPWVLLTLLGLIGFLIGEWRDDRRIVAVCKPLASAGFLGAALAAGALGSAYGRAVLAALVLSWIGDVLLIPRHSGAFLAGLAAFLLGHVAFAAAFLLRNPSRTWTAAALAILILPALIVDRWLRPHLPPRMRLPVRAYIAAITLMLSLAAGTLGSGVHPILVAGALAFYLSDLSVARDRFIRESFVNRLWGLPLYYAAQLALAWSVAL